MSRESKAIKKLLFEAYRRNQMKDIHGTHPLTKRWLGFGTASAYEPIIKAGMMRFHNGQIPPPRCMGWLCLTASGVVALEKHEAEFASLLENLKAEGYEQSVSAQYVFAGGFSSRLTAKKMTLS